MDLTDKTLVQVLIDEGGWVDSSRLSEVFNVTSRTVRARVQRVNNARGAYCIESSHKGYRAMRRCEGDVTATPDIYDGDGISPRRRIKLELAELIRGVHPVSIYDLAEEHCVSDSTIRADLRKLASQINGHKLQLAYKRDIVSIEGAERDKRRLIGEIVSESEQGIAGAIALGVNELFFVLPFTSEELVQSLKESLAAHHLICTGFYFDNVVLHLAISLSRMHSGKTMVDDSASETLSADQPAYQVASDILLRFGDQMGLIPSNAEIGYAAWAIFANSSRAHVVGSGPSEPEQLNDNDMRLAYQVVRPLEVAYDLEPFDDEFIIRLSSHLHGMIRRLKSSMRVRNPLLEKTKVGYPLVYDMAVHLAGGIQHEVGLPVNEEEIAFLAFHIGGYYESKRMDRNFVTCVFCYVPYQNLHHDFIDYFNSAFKGRAALIETCELPVSNVIEKQCDVVFTQTDVAAPRAMAVVKVGPMLSDQNKAIISRAVEEAYRMKRGRRAASLLQRYLRRDLYRRNHPASDRNELIWDIVNDCRQKGLCDDNLYQAICDREEISSTAFGNQVAVPHSATPCSNQPFLYIVLNERPVRWGEQKVNIALLIGTTEEERSSFRTVFENLLEVLSNPINASRLIGTQTYDEFVGMLVEMIMNGESKDRFW